MPKVGKRESESEIVNKMLSLFPILALRMEGKVLVRYQHCEDYEDQFREAGNLTESEALHFFDAFPFEVECAKWPEMPNNSPYPTLHFNRNDKAYARIQMQEIGEYILEIRRDGRFFEILFNADFHENPRQEARQYISDFISARLDQNVEWTNEWAEERYGREEGETRQTPRLEFHFEESWQHWIHFPEIVFAPVGLLFVGMGLSSGVPIVMILGILALVIPCHVHFRLWRLRNQVKGSRIAILPEEHSFLWERDGSRHLVHRDELEKCTLLLHKTRSSVRLELQMHLKDGSEIKLNSLLFDPTLLLRELNLKYRVA